MIIYKITNKINNKIYIGQTVTSLAARWYCHVHDSKRVASHPFYNAIKKYGKENFNIEEIGGANNITELNYQEWLLIHKHNTLWPNGYNLKEGGKNKGKKLKHAIDKISKKVIDLKTGKVYKSATECARINGLNKATLNRKLAGTRGNNTDFRYLGEEYKSKNWVGLDNGLGMAKKVICIKTGKIYKSAKKAYDKNKNKISSYRTFLRKLKNKSELNFQYILNPM